MDHSSRSLSFPKQDVNEATNYVKRMMYWSLAVFGMVAATAYMTSRMDYRPVARYLGIKLARPNAFAPDDPVPLWPRPRRIEAPGDVQRDVALPGPWRVAVEATGVSVQPVIQRYLPLLFPCEEDLAQRVLPKGHPDLREARTVIQLSVASADETLSINTNERYALDIRRVEEGKQARVKCEAANVYGLMRCLDTLSQIIQPTKKPRTSVLPAAPSTGQLPRQNCGTSVLRAAPLRIVDWPRTAHRGLLLDTSRHFIPIPAIKLLIDGMAAGKLNVLHLHLTDAQSFPLVLDTIPELGIKGAYSEEETYTTQDMKDLIEYARLHGIRIMPEIDIPGHVFSFAAAYPEIVLCQAKQPFAKWGASPPTGQLDPTSPRTYEVIEKVFKGIHALFPDAYVHLGHDEINGKCWEQLPSWPGDLNAKLKQFHKRLQPVLDRAIPGRQRVVWEEPFVNHDAKGDGPLTYDTVQLWLQCNEKMVRKVQCAGKQVIVSCVNAWYLDCGHGQWLTSGGADPAGWCGYRGWPEAYKFEPFGNGTRGDDAEPPAADPQLAPPARDAVLGGEVAMWSELVDEGNLLPRVFPRTLAFAERAWAHPGADHGYKQGAEVAMDAVTNRLHVAREILLTRRGIPSSPIQPQWCHGRAAQCDW